MTRVKTIFCVVLTTAMVGLPVFPGDAQNFADVGTTVSESQVKENSDGSGFTVEPLNPKVHENIESLVEPSKMVPISFGESSTYTLGPTDVIQINVNRHPEVTGDYVINMEGKIQYEFVGDLKIAGLTKELASDLLKKALEQYIISPEITVKIIGYNSKIVYVVGEVANPGKIFMRGDTISVREALMQAGLPMLTGVTAKSKLITPSYDGNAIKKDINVYALLYEGDLREDATMYPGDVLYIPPTFLTKAMRAISPIAAPIGTAAGTARSVTPY